MMAARYAIVFESACRNRIASVAAFFLTDLKPFLESLLDGADFAGERPLLERTDEFSRNSRASFIVTNVL